MMFDFAAYLIVGALVVLSAWIPLFVKQVPISLPMIAVGIGCLLALSPAVGDPYAGHSALMLHLSEFALLVSVFGAGLKIDRRFSFRAWATTWRMLGIVMPLSIAVVAYAGYALLGLSIGFAILLSAILSPTDPVLASSFGSGPPGRGEEGEAKFALTSESGLNDGLAFPFVLLALAIIGGPKARSSLLDWALLDFLWDVCGGVIVGMGLGWVLTWINRMLPQPVRLSASKSGLVSVGLAFIAYGAAVALQCNGFVAVFCEAVAIRNFTSRSEYSQRLNHAAAQFERLAMVGVLMLLGVSLVRGQLDDVGYADIGYAVIVLLLVRPVAALLGCIGSDADRWTRAALSYLGIRGIGSLYYVTLAGAQLTGPEMQRSTAIVALVILGSVVFYGTTAGTASHYLLTEQKTPAALEAGQMESKPD